MNALRNFRGVKTTPTKYFNQFNHKPDLVVVGGNGFVGRYVCRVAAQNGLNPVSISPNPSPPCYAPDDGEDIQWVMRTQWRKGDAVKPDTWDPEVVEAGCTAMIYTTHPSYSSETLLWQCNYEGALHSIEMARKMGAKRFVYMSTNFMPPLATQVERQTKKAAEQALMEFSQESLKSNAPIALSILKPGWIYGCERIMTSIVGLLCHNLFDRSSGRAVCELQPPRNLSSISVKTLAVAAACQGLDDDLPPLMKLYNQDMQIYSDPKAERWLMDMAVRLKR